MIEGLRLMVVGMSTVFAFLGLLVFSMSVMARLFKEEPPTPGDDRPDQVPHDEEIDVAIALAAIAAWKHQQASAEG